MTLLSKPYLCQHKYFDICAVDKPQGANPAIFVTFSYYYYCVFNPSHLHSLVFTLQT